MIKGEYRLPGYFGIAIYGSLFLYTLIRFFTLLNIHDPMNSIKYFNYKIGFHIVFGLYCLCDAIYSYSLTIDNR